tara:strand:- start:378 stop:506 length:129 start_codon:yes stop_codon:yes gene_type:complete
VEAVAGKVDKPTTGVEAVAEVELEVSAVMVPSVLVAPMERLE